MLLCGYSWSIVAPAEVEAARQAVAAAVGLAARDPDRQHRHAHVRGPALAIVRGRHRGTGGN